MTPFSGEGISIVALSVSIVTSPSSRSTVSPAPTRTSITSTLSKSPRSGTTMSIVFATYTLRLQCHRIRTIRIDTVLLDRLADRLLVKNAILRKRVQCRDRNESAIDFKVLAEGLACIAAPITIGAQRIEISRNPTLDLV